MSHARPGLRPSWYLAVALGSALGGLARWLLSDLLQGAPGSGFPWGTLWVNVSGSLLIGWYAARLTAGGLWARGTRRHLLFTSGFCGGYTTFSLFSLEVVLLVQAGDIGLASAYMGASLALWLAGAWLGYVLGRQGRWGAAR
jgi:fluoride exporter